MKKTKVYKEAFKRKLVLEILQRVVRKKKKVNLKSKESETSSD